MFGLGLPELGILAVVGMLLFGPSKLPQLGKGLGEAISGFRKELKETEHNAGEIENAEKNKT
ncbi:MAG: twin-arginine translocase TatA/TatE family subunit [Nitrospiraceae bacterium]|nr:twin-arginine translocase TatA/TatE family subunit [Nitrospiraceae bacterium]